jgi:hypothetical protein
VPVLLRGGCEGATWGVGGGNIEIMMMRHRRLPAIAVLVAMIGLGAVYMRTWGRGAGGDGSALADLE